MDALIHLAGTLPQSKVADLGMGSINLNLPGMIAVGRILRSCALTHLNLSYNNLNLEMVQTLISCFPVCKTLTNLNLSGCGLTPESCTLLLDSLSLSSSLTSLDLSENDLKGCTSSLLAAISSPSTKLKSLSLTETCLTLPEITRILQCTKKAGVEVESDFPRLLGDRLRREDSHSLIYKLASFLDDA